MTDVLTKEEREVWERLQCHAAAGPVGCYGPVVYVDYRDFRAMTDIIHRLTQAATAQDFLAEVEALRAIKLAAQALIDSGHNGRLYAAEYDALQDALNHNPQE